MADSDPVTLISYTHIKEENTVCSSESDSAKDNEVHVNGTVESAAAPTGSLLTNGGGDNNEELVSPGSIDTENVTEKAEQEVQSTSIENLSSEAECKGVDLSVTSEENKMEVHEQPTDSPDTPKDEEKSEEEHSEPAAVISPSVEQENLEQASSSEVVVEPSQIVEEQQAKCISEPAPTEEGEDVVEPMEESQSRAEEVVESSEPQLESPAVDTNVQEPSEEVELVGEQSSESAQHEETAAPGDEEQSGGEVLSCGDDNATEETFEPTQTEPVSESPQPTEPVSDKSVVAPVVSMVSESAPEDNAEKTQEPSEPDEIVAPVVETSVEAAAVAPVVEKSVEAAPVVTASETTADGNGTEAVGGDSKSGETSVNDDQINEVANKIVREVIAEASSIVQRDHLEVAQARHDSIDETELVVDEADTILEIVEDPLVNGIINRERVVVDEQSETSHIAVPDEKVDKSLPSDQSQEEDMSQDGETNEEETDTVSPTTQIVDVQETPEEQPAEQEDIKTDKGVVGEEQREEVAHVASSIIVEKDTSATAQEAPMELESIPAQEAPTEQESIPTQEAPNEHDSIPTQEAPTEPESIPVHEAPSEEESIPVDEIQIVDVAPVASSLIVGEDSTDPSAEAPTDLEFSPANVAVENPAPLSSIMAEDTNSPTEPAASTPAENSTGTEAIQDHVSLDSKPPRKPSSPLLCCFRPPVAKQETDKMSDAKEEVQTTEQTPEQAEPAAAAEETAPVDAPVATEGETPAAEPAEVATESAAAEPEAEEPKVEPEEEVEPEIVEPTGPLVPANEDGSKPLILVSGASGYIASHIVKFLLEDGQRVRGTVRSLENEEKVKPLRELCPEAENPLELVEADLTKPETWEGVLKDCTYVIHVASPFPLTQPKDESEVIQPAVEGTQTVLKACSAAKTVKRVVLTSSVVAIRDFSQASSDPNMVYNEETWTDTESQPAVTAYAKSKTLAEKAAWDFINELPDDEKFELAVINPAYVIGPVLSGANHCTSMEIPKRLLERATPMLPKLNFPVVDVRDVALAHIRALTMPDAAGKRHILFTKNMWMKEIAQCVAKEFKPQGYNVPTTNAPYFGLWLYGLFDKTVKQTLPMVGKVVRVENKRMKHVLKIKSRDVKDTIIDMCYSLIDNGLVKRSKKYRGGAKPEGEAGDKAEEPEAEQAEGEAAEGEKPTDNGEVVKTEGEEQAVEKEAEKEAEPATAEKTEETPAAPAAESTEAKEEEEKCEPSEEKKE